MSWMLLLDLPYLVVVTVTMFLFNFLQLLLSNLNFENFRNDCIKLSCKTKKKGTRLISDHEHSKAAEKYVVDKMKYLDLNLLGNCIDIFFLSQF